MYTTLKPLIHSPQREVLKQTMPMDFRKHCPNCAVIIDLFEIFTERPSNLLARAQTCSSYKHHNTAKYLIGITPQGTMCYISSGWGGRVSDKHLTENWGLLNYLLPGDTILADKGFDIQESMGLYCAQVSIPSFTRGKNSQGLKWSKHRESPMWEFTLSGSLVFLDKNTHFYMEHSQWTS